VAGPTDRPPHVRRLERSGTPESIILAPCTEVQRVAASPGKGVEPPRSLLVPKLLLGCVSPTLRGDDGLDGRGGVPFQAMVHDQIRRLAESHGPRRNLRQSVARRGVGLLNLPVRLEQVHRLLTAAALRRYAEAYLDHFLGDGPEPQEFKVGQGRPSFSYLRRRIARILNEQDT
jgi:hypothetical protein